MNIINKICSMNIENFIKEINLWCEGIKKQCSLIINPQNINFILEIMNIIIELVFIFYYYIIN